MQIKASLSASLMREGADESGEPGQNQSGADHPQQLSRRRQAAGAAHECPRRTTACPLRLAGDSMQLPQESCGPPGQPQT